MAVKPGYKRTEVGVIPEHWDVKSLGSLFEFTNGVNADKSAYGQGVRFINVLEPISHSHLYGPEIPGRVTVSGSVASAFSVRSGDVVFNRTSETDSELGLAAVYLGNEQVVFGGFVIRARPIDDALDPKYAGYALRARMIRSQIIPMGQGAVRANIGQANLRRVLTPVPPKLEQRAIASALGDVDALLDGLDRLIAKKRDLKQAAMKQFLTGKTRLPGFGEQWKTVELGDIATVRNLKVQASSTPPGTPCIELDSLSGGGTGRLLQTTVAAGASIKYSFRRGDVLFGRLRAYLKKYWIAEFDGCCSTEIWPLVPKDDRLNAAYLYLLVQTEAFLKAAGVSYGTHMPRSDWSVLTRLAFDLPPYAEQVAIATVLTDMDAELAALEACRAKTRDLKQAMMQELLTGRTRLVPPLTADA